MSESKKQLVLYILMKLKEWYQDINGGTKENDLSILKVLKLIFFVAGVKIDENTYLLDKELDQFAALPYGHVELEVYNYLENDCSRFISKKTLNFEQIPAALELTEDIKVMVDKCFDILRKKNSKLINYTPFELVELSHKHISWIENFRIAQSRFRNRKDIEPNEIKKEVKFYIL